MEGYSGLVIPVMSGNTYIFFLLNLYKVKQFVGRGAAQLGLFYPLCGVGIGSDMLKEDQGGDNGHFTLAGTVVVFVHIENGFKKNVQILVVKTGLGCQIGTDKSSNLI